MDVLPTLASAVRLVRDSEAFRSIDRRHGRRTMSSPELCWPVPMRAIGAQNLLTMPGGVSSSGYLHKKGGSQFSLMKWPLRYIIIHKGCVYYFKSSTSAAPQGAFSLNGYNRVMRAAEETTSSNVFPFKIVHYSKRHRTWLFSAASEDERRKWMRHLRREISRYNDRKECLISSDSDSDADSFYGTIERTMDIRHTDHNADDDYVEEDEDEDDEEDYLKPDGDCSPTPPVRPAGPCPSYPPPPVPAAFRANSSVSFPKPAPPPVLPLHRIPTSPLSKKPLPSVPPPSGPLPSILREPAKGPPPPLPFAPHLHKLSEPPPPPPPNAKRATQSRTKSSGDTGNAKRDWRPLPAISANFSATLPICDQPQSRMVLNGPALSVGGSQSLGNQHQELLCSPRAKPTVPPHFSGYTGGSSSSCLPPLPDLPSLLPLLPKSGAHSRPLVPKPPPPTMKPPMPADKPRQTRSQLQRTSPEGQSFRSSGDEMPSECFGTCQPGDKVPGGRDDDGDYEDMQLPDSVFIDTTETCIVEKMFKDGPKPPQDGVYGIRNSGTKTSKVLVVWDASICKARNYRVFVDEERLFLDSEVTFFTLPALIEHYHRHPLPHHGSLCLQKPFTDPSAETGIPHGPDNGHSI